MNDFYEYVKTAGEILHKGAPYAFFLKHQKKYLIAAEEKKREKRLLLRDENSWEFPMHEINAAGTCPEDMDGLGGFSYRLHGLKRLGSEAKILKPLKEPWDYDEGQNVTVVIENRKILLTKDVTVGHLGEFFE